MYASLFSALAEGSGLDEEALYEFFIDGLVGHIRDTVLFAELLPTLDQVIQLAVQIESLWQDNQAQLDIPPQTLLPRATSSPYPVSFSSPGPISCSSLGPAPSSSPLQGFSGDPGLAGGPWSVGGPGPLQASSCPGPLQPTPCQGLL